MICGGLSILLMATALGMTLLAGLYTKPPPEAFARSRPLFVFLVNDTGDT